jgi:DTW domain-containing protein
VPKNEKGGAPPVEPVDNGLFILILQHPRERRQTLATATLTVAALRRAKLVIGLSWPNLARTLGRPADPERWAALHLGSVRPSAFGSAREVLVLNRRGEPVADQEAVLRGLEGAVLLDGSWSEAKTLWWRNPWLLKLHRLVLNPQHKSRYGRLRREPRREALSTLEAAALLLKHCDGNGGQGLEAVLLGKLERLISETATDFANASSNKSGSLPLQPH